MNKWQLFKAIGQADPKYLEESEEKQPAKGKTWLKWGALAACICLVVGLLWPRMGTNSTSSESVETASNGEALEAAPAEGAAVEEPAAAEPGESADGKHFTSYQGPILPLTAVEDGASLSISRDISFEIDSTMLFSDQYTLENTTDQDITITAAYPFVGSLSELTVPLAYVDGEAAEAQLRCGSFAGGFYGFASPDAGSNERWNIAYMESFEDYQSLLEDGSYAENTFDSSYDLSQAVTVYYFETTGSSDEQAATIAVSMNLNSNTTVLSYGFNGWSQDDKGDTTFSYFIRHGSLRMLIVLGQDIGDFSVQGYENGACDPGTELEDISADWTREETTLGQVLEVIAREYQDYDRDLFLQSMAEFLMDHGQLSPDPAERYDSSYLDTLITDAASADRIFYQVLEVTVPAGASVTLTFEGEKQPSFNYYDTGDVTLRGYELATTLGSSLTFQSQTARLENSTGLTAEKDDFGFDFGAESSTVTLDQSLDSYELIIRE